MYEKVKISDLGSNMDEYLAHSGTKGMVWKGHKYVEKKMVNGKWRYYYKTKKNDKPDRETDDEAWVYNGKDEEGNNVFELVSVSENDQKFDEWKSGETGTVTKKKKHANGKTYTETYTKENGRKTRNPNKLYNSAISKYDYYLAHHGIAGQKWGEKNGPPYPLDASDHSSAEKKKDYQDNAYAKREGKSPSGKKVTDNPKIKKEINNQKKALNRKSNIREEAKKTGKYVVFDKSMKGLEDSVNKSLAKGRDAKFTDKERKTLFDEFGIEESRRKNYYDADLSDLVREAYMENQWDDYDIKFMAKHSSISKHDYYLAHHGIKGQKWGEQNGPPYPLDPSKDYSDKEKSENMKKGVIKAGTQVKRLSSHSEEKLGTGKYWKTYVNQRNDDAKKYRNFYVDSLKDFSGNAAVRKKAESFAKMKDASYQDKLEMLKKASKNAKDNQEVFEHTYEIVKDVKIASIDVWDKQKEESVDKAFKNHEKEINKFLKDNNVPKGDYDLVKMEMKNSLSRQFDLTMQLNYNTDKSSSKETSSKYDTLGYTKDFRKINDEAHRDFIDSLKKKGYGAVEDAYSTGKGRARSAGETKAATIVFDSSAMKLRETSVVQKNGAAVVAGILAGVGGVALSVALSVATMGVGAGFAPAVIVGTSEAGKNAAGRYKSKNISKAVSGFSKKELQSKIAYYKESGTDPAYLKKLEAELDRRN